MNKKDLVKYTAERTPLSQKECMQCLDAITDIIYDALKKGEDVSIMGFGKFSARQRHERKIINPQTRRPMTIGQRTVPVFVSGSEFKKKVN